MPAPLILAGLAAGGFAKSGGLGGIIGSGRRKREEQAAKVEQRERQYDYENFDYNQDVGPINNPYADTAQRQQDFLQENIDRSSANAIDASQRAGNAGAAQYAAFRQVDASRQAGQQVQAIRQQGANFVESQRQARIAQRYDQAGTFLARSDDRLAQAQAARKRATEKIFKGIGGAATAVAGGISGGGGLSALKDGTFDAKGALGGSGLLPEGFLGKTSAATSAVAGPVGIANTTVNAETGLGTDGYAYDDLGYTNLDDLYDYGDPTDEDTNYSQPANY